MVWNAGISNRFFRPRRMFAWRSTVFTGKTGRWAISLTPMKLVPCGLVMVKEIAARYGISKTVIYELIKSDPTFPYRNVGLKKKLMIDVAAFEAWIEARTERQKNENFNLPTAARLLEKYRK